MKILLIIFVMMISAKAFTGTEGGGGDAVILPDGSVVLADVFLDRQADQPTNRPKQIELNPKILLQAKTYAEFIYAQINLISNEDRALSGIFESLTMKYSKLSFYVVSNVEELGHFCTHGVGKNYKTESGELVQRIACTVGDETYLVESNFSSLDVREQALILLHERLTAYRDDNGGRNFSVVGRFITGLRTSLKNAFDQQAKNYRFISKLEVEEIKDFFNSAIYLATYNMSRPVWFMKESWSIHPSGGGLIFNDADINPKAFIGIHTRIFNQINLADNTVITDSDLRGQIVIKENSLIEQSKIEAYDLSIGPNSRIKKSEFKKVNLQSGARLIIENSKIASTNTPIQLGESASLRNGFVSAASNQYFAPLGFELIYPVIKMKNFETECNGRMTRERGYYDCSFFTRTYKEAEERLQDLTFNGLSITLTNLSLQLYDRPSSSDLPVYAELYTFDAIIEFHSFRENWDWDKRFYFMSYKGQFYPIGEYLLRDASFTLPYEYGRPKDPALSYIRDYAISYLKQKNFRFEGNYIYLPFKEQ